MSDPIAKEVEFLHKPGEAHAVFLEMPRQHPDELRDFTDLIHRMQDLIAVRVARAYRPDVYPIKDENGEVVER